MKNQKMKAAFATWNDRIAPVFDVSESLLLLEIEGGRVVRETRHILSGDDPEEQVRALVETGAEVLVCGAISRFLCEQIMARGVRVMPFIAGTLTEIIEAWNGGTLGKSAYAMPGCYRRGHERIGYGSENIKEVNPMNTGGQRRGAGRGAGQGMRGGGMGRGGGPLAAGPVGECVCPKCGHAEPHERGVRCVDRNCPKCGSVLTRR